MIRITTETRRRGEKITNNRGDGEMETKGNEDKKMCAATASRTGKRCGHAALADSDFCAAHKNKDLKKEAQTGGRKRPPLSEPASAAAAAQPEMKKPSPKGNGLCKRIERMSHDPGLLNQIRTAVAAIKALLDEHLAQLDEVRMSDAEGAAEVYAAALESHGKRIQSLAGELFEAIDRISKIDERQRKLMTPDEIKTLIANIRERVIKAAEAAKPGEPPEALAGRLADAFESIEVSERE